MENSEIAPVLRHMATFQDLSQARLESFKRYFWLGSTLGLAGFLFLGFSQSLESLAGALLIYIVAMIPWYLWSHGMAKGLPIWPMFTLTAVIAYAIPLVTEHPIVVLFPGSIQFVAALTISFCLLLATAAWYPLVKERARAPRVARVLPMLGGKMVFWFFMVASLLMTISTNAGYVDATSIVYPLFRGVVSGISSLALFFFGFQHGSGQLSKAESTGYLILLALTVLVSFTSMLLIAGMSMCLTTVIAFMLGRGKIPWKAIGVVGMLVTFLHFGKSEQRDAHWEEQMFQTVDLIDYPSFYASWAGFSVKAIYEAIDPTEKKDKFEEQNSKALWERSSLMHLFLYIQYATPGMVPYLNGLTYSAIPELLIPRIFLKEKVLSHFGNNVLAVHYGIIPNDAETKTSVGFGLMNEAYANFGLMGCGVITVLVAMFFGWVSKQSMSVPLMSFRFLFAVIILGNAFQVEYTAGVFVSSAFQATIALSGVAFLFMRPFAIARIQNLLASMVRDAKVESVTSTATDATPVSAPSVAMSGTRATAGASV